MPKWRGNVVEESGGQVMSCIWRRSDEATGNGVSTPSAARRRGMSKRAIFCGERDDGGGRKCGRLENGGEKLNLKIKSSEVVEKENRAISS